MKLESLFRPLLEINRTPLGGSVRFHVFTSAYHYDGHFSFDFNEAVHNPNATSPELDFHEARQIRACLVSKRLAESAFVLRQWVRSDSFYSLKHVFSLGTIETLEILESIRVESDFVPAHSNSTSSI